MAVVWPEPVSSVRPVPERPGGLNIIGAEEIFADLPAVRWLCQGLCLAPGAPTIFAGYGYSGKSAATQALCLSVATGHPLWGKYVTSTGNVLHLDYEQGSRISRERYQRIAYAEGLDVRTIIRSGRLELGVLPSVPLDRDLLCRIGESRTLVNIDSWRASHPAVDENSSEVRKTLDAMGIASEKTGCTYTVLAHAKKPQKDAVGGKKFAIRGSGGFFDGAQSIFYLDGETVGKPEVSHEKDRISGQEISPFSLQFTDIDGRAGLLIRAEDIEEKVEEHPAQKFSKTMATIGELCRLKPGLSGSAIAEMIGKNKSHTLAAIQSLKAEGLIVAVGTGPAARLYHKSNVPQPPF